MKMNNRRFSLVNPFDTPLRRILILAALFFITLGWSTPTWSQLTIPARGAFGIAMDACSFNGDSTQDFVEVYYGIRENCITYGLDSGRYTGAVNMSMEIRSDSGIVARKGWSVPHIVSDTSKLSGGQQLMGLESVGLPPGRYMVTVKGYDLRRPARRDSVSAPLIVEKYPSDTESLSDLEFCTLIQSSTNKQSRFYKNTLEVVPNAGRLYGTGLPIIYYYLEVYGLVKSGRTGAVTIHTAVLDINGTEVVSHDKAKTRLHDASVEVGTMNIGALRSGTYVFRATLLDSTKRILASKEKKFYVYKPGSLPDTLSHAAREPLAAMDYYAMSDSAVTLEFNEASYIATQAEILQFEKLTDTRAKQQYLYEFWQRRNPDSTTLANAFRDQYLERVDHANKNLTVGFHPGWKTDRGRVYILYGPPDEVERFASSQESLPYEIWHYNNIQGGVIFVFVDRSGTGAYDLVHSTHRSEMQDPDWYEHYAHQMH